MNKKQLAEYKILSFYYDFIQLGVGEDIIIYPTTFSESFYVFNVIDRKGEEIFIFVNKKDLGSGITSREGFGCWNSQRGV